MYHHVGVVTEERRPSTKAHELVARWCIEDGGADVRAMNTFGNTGVHYACAYSSLSLVGYLATKGALPDIMLMPRYMYALVPKCVVVCTAGMCRSMYRKYCWYVS